MKKIRLKRIHYINWCGIVLSGKNPSIEATEENIKKLEKFIKIGQLEIIDEDEDNRKNIEIPFVEDKPISNIPESKGVIVTSVERVEEYTEEYLKSLNKQDLINICEKKGLEFKKNMSVSKLEELILKNQ